MKNFVLNFILPNNYIDHHLKHLQFNILGNFLTKSSKLYSFFLFNIDSIFFSFILGFIFWFFVIFLVKNINYNKLPNNILILLEIIIVFILYNVKDIFGKKDKYVFSLAFTVFTWILFMNLISLLPLDLFPLLFSKMFGIQYLSYIPTTDVNITLSMALSVLFYSFFYKFYYFGFKKKIKDFCLHPFNSIFLIPLNIILETVNFFSKILSLSLRLFGNIYSGEIIIILISFIIPWWLQWLFILPCNFLHLFISFLQAFIFMILTIVYIS